MRSASRPTRCSLRCSRTVWRRRPRAPSGSGSAHWRLARSWVPGRFCPSDVEWPATFELVKPRPGVLFLRGARLRRPAAAVVGSRQADAYGLDLARAIGFELAARGQRRDLRRRPGHRRRGPRGSARRGGRRPPPWRCSAAGSTSATHRSTARCSTRSPRGARCSASSRPGPSRCPSNFHAETASSRRCPTRWWSCARPPASGSLARRARPRSWAFLCWRCPGQPAIRCREGTNQLLRHGALLCEGTADVLAAVRARKPAPAALLEQLSLPELPAVTGAAPAPPVRPARSRGG